MRDPRTAGEWQAAVDGASFCLHLHAADAYGLVAQEIDIDVARCEDILSRGRAIGFEPCTVEEYVERELGS